MEGRRGKLTKLTSETFSVNSVNHMVASKKGCPILAYKLNLSVRHFECNRVCYCDRVYPRPMFPLRTLSQAESCIPQQLRPGTC